MKQEEALILDIRTDPPERPITFYGKAPSIYYDVHEDRHLIKWSDPATFPVIGYQTLDLLTGEIERDVEITKEEDLFYLRHLITPRESRLVPYPLVLVVSTVVADLAYQCVISGWAGVNTRNPNLDTLPLGYSYHARVDRSWEGILQHDRGHTEREHLLHTCQVLGVKLEGTETPGMLLRRLVLHLAEQDPILVESEEVGQ